MQTGARVGVDMVAEFLKHAFDEGIWVSSIVPFLCRRQLPYKIKHVCDEGIERLEINLLCLCW